MYASKQKSRHQAARGARVFASANTARAGAASLARASIKKIRHQAARGALNKLPEATGAHGAPQIPLEGVQGVMLISTG